MRFGRHFVIRMVVWSQIRREEDDVTFVDPAEAGRQHSRRVVRGGTRERRRKIAGRGLESLCESAEYRSASWKHFFTTSFAPRFSLSRATRSSQVWASRGWKCSRENSRKEWRKSGRSLLDSNWKLVVSMAERREFSGENLSQPGRDLVFVRVNTRRVALGN